MLALLALGWLGACVPNPYDKNLVSQLDREVLAMREKNAILEKRLTNCSEEGQPSEFFAQMNSIFSGTEVKVERSGPFTIMAIPGDVLFSKNSLTIRDEAAMVLDMLSTGLELHQDTQLWIVGHTDDRPLTGSQKRYVSHWGLSTAMAASVLQTLTKDYGVEETRVTVAGRGATRPVGEGDTPGGRTQNRRIVVVVGPLDTW